MCTLNLKPNAGQHSGSGGQCGTLGYCLFNMVWLGLVWSGLFFVWYGIVRFGMVWFDLVWFGMVFQAAGSSGQCGAV